MEKLASTALVVLLCFGCQGVEVENGSAEQDRVSTAIPIEKDEPVIPPAPIDPQLEEKIHEIVHQLGVIDEKEPTKAILLRDQAMRELEQIAEAERYLKECIVPADPAEDGEIERRARLILRAFEVQHRGKIVFVKSLNLGRTDIWSVDFDGQNPTPLTQTGTDESPLWSPDGRKIAFCSHRDKNAEIYVMDGDGKNQTRLTHSEAWDDSPAWSPDGQKMAFVSYQDYVNGKAQIYAFNSDGGNLIQLTSEGDSNVSPVWSPDGKRIAFLSNRDGPTYELYVMDADGKNQTRLTNNDADDRAPAWSPDGKEIAFVSGNHEFSHDIYILDADGSNLRNLTNNEGRDDSFVWSPDGKQLAFVSNRGSKAEIYVTDPQGIRSNNLTKHKTYDSSPTWGPDSTKIAFLSIREGHFGIYVMDRDGGNAKLLLATPAESLTWQSVKR